MSLEVREIIESLVSRFVRDVSIGDRAGIIAEPTTIFPDLEIEFRIKETSRGLRPVILLWTVGKKQEKVYVEIGDKVVVSKLKNVDILREVGILTETQANLLKQGPLALWRELAKRYNARLLFFDPLVTSITKELLRKGLLPENTKVWLNGRLIILRWN